MINQATIRGLENERFVVAAQEWLAGKGFELGSERGRAGELTVAAFRAVAGSISRETTTPDRRFPSGESLRAAAWMIGCEEAAIRAIADVEAGATGAFLANGKPTILFERHYFSKLTGGRFDGRKVDGLADAHAIISSSSPGGYGPVSAQHPKLEAAMKLDSEAAMKSASWGLFQIMGANHKKAGFRTVVEFVEAMNKTADDHLRALVRFILSDDLLAMAIRDKNWRTFALSYNGPAAESSRYPQRLAASYQKFAKVS